MKTNKMMRVASVLLVAVLLTTCAISGTFAKYVTQNAGADQATVAKFGVTIAVEDDMGLFATQYDATGAYDGTLSVKSNGSVGTNADNRVAPGTKGSMSFTITGTPEVATQLNVTVTGTAIHLAPGTYTLGAGKFDNTETSVTTTADYEPIKFYFGTTAISGSTVYNLTLEGLQDALQALTSLKAPNTTLDVTYYIGWEWAFEGTATGAFDGETPYTGATVADFLDTYLANEGTLQTESLNISFSITQVDADTPAPAPAG